MMIMQTNAIYFLILLFRVIFNFNNTDEIVSLIDDQFSFFPKDLIKSVFEIGKGDWKGVLNLMETMFNAL